MKLQVKTEKKGFEDVVLNYFQEVKQRVLLADPVRNPFTRPKISLEVKKNAYIIRLSLESFYFVLSNYFLLLVFALLTIGSVIKGALWFPWWVLLLFVVAVVYVFVTSHYWYYELFKLGLRKKGYTGKISLQKYCEVEK